MIIHNVLDLIGKGYRLLDLYQEDELEAGKEYVVCGAGILQRGACCRDLHNPRHYDEWFDTEEECIEYIQEIEGCGYGNTITGPWILYQEVRKIK